MIKENSFLKKDRGFSIIEVALVLIIGGTLLATASSALLVYLKTTQHKTTQQKIEQIDEALGLFLNLNGRLPCPARRSDAVDSATFGVEISDDCNGAPITAGTVQINTGRDGRRIRIGVVPTRTLNLPDDYMIDAWGQRFTYAVTEILASPGTFNRELGAVFINDSAGNPAIDPPGSAHYVVLSHGKNGSGATNLNGVPGVPCIAGNVDEENCDDNSTFIRTILNSQTYDDLVTLKTTSTFGAIFPPDAVMAFNSNACPLGWDPFIDPATGQPFLAGRSIIGVGNYNATYNEPGRTGWSVNETFNLRETGGFAEWRESFDESGIEPVTTDATTAGGGETLARTLVQANAQKNRSPYLALLYCIKL